MVKSRNVIASLMVLAGALTTSPQSKPLSHEEEVVRNTYAALSFLCGIPPVATAAVEQISQHNVSQDRVDRAVSDATPVFEITDVKTGRISSIAGMSWSTRFSVPETNDEHNYVLEGRTVRDGYSDASTNAAWTGATVKWSINDSYTPERMNAIQKTTVGQAVAMNNKGDGNSWTVRANYTRYATFDVAIIYQNRTVGPYTASFIFGKDSHGVEVVAPQDAFVSGQLLWDALHQTAYPQSLLKSRLREQPALSRWIDANREKDCRASRKDLCCSADKCALPEQVVARDLAAPLPN